MFRHPFIFETKGSDSSRDDLIEEYKGKSREYLQSISSARYAVITNMCELVVFAKEGDRLLEQYSFSFRALYGSYKDREVFSLNDPNVARFLRFVRDFSRKPLSTEDKIKAIADAKKHPVPTAGPTVYREYETLTDSIRKIVEWFREDVRAERGPDALREATQHSPDRRRTIAMEIYAIRGERSKSYEIPDEITSEDLGKVLESKDREIVQAVDLYFYRVAYFTMVRVLLIRAWEDSGFIDEEFQTLYDGGFAKWYFQTFNKRILDVLKQAFAFAKEKYEWLYTEQTNYSWYLPTDDTLVDVLYELAKYDLSVLNRDVLGVVYEDYLGTQDKKNMGQYYTPFPIVKLIWDRIVYHSNDDFYRIEEDRRIPKTVLDPATGSGGFLVEAARRIRSYSQPADTLETLLDVKNAIIHGLCGSEISVFSYYITEVSLLIQLTPVIQKIVAVEPKRRDVEGKFTLSVVRQNSLSLHNPPETIDEGVKPKADEHTHYGLELLKPVGEKLRVYESIKNKSDFDYVAANPPYIGEDRHKELFRKTLSLFPYWKRYFQGKMDYLYFFVILGIQKLRSKGRLGFITTSYWLTADGASKLRKYILEHARLVEIINFHEVKLFEHAKGQHNIIFVLERESDPEKRARNRIKLVETRKEFEGSDINARLQSLCNHIGEKIQNSRYSDEYIDVYYSPVVQADLTDRPWYIFHKRDDESLLKKIRSAGANLDTLADVHQGVIPGCLSVDKTVLEALPQKTIEEYGIKKGMGVFVLNADELKVLCLPKPEQKIIRPYYKNSNIHRYVVDRHDESYLIYAREFESKNVKLRIKDYPTVLRHLEIFRPRLELKRETVENRLPWWSLHWPREESIFEGKKIVCPYRSKVNTFAYDDGAFYGSTDMYFITEKRDSKLDGQPHHDLRYILGLLNSNVIRFWTQHKTKPKGEIRELFYTPLREFPIRAINFVDKKEVKRYEDIISWVGEIIDLKNRALRYDTLFHPRLTELMEDEELPGIEEEMITQLMPPSKIKSLQTCQAVSYDGPSQGFQLRRVKAIESTALKKSRFKYQLVLEGKDGQIVPVEGDRGILLFLKRVLANMQGSSWTEIEHLRLPASAEALKQSLEKYERETSTLWNRIKELQSKIDNQVCELYGIEKDTMDAAVCRK